MKGLLKNLIRRFGYELRRYDASLSAANRELDSLSDLNDAQRKIVARVKPFTMTSVERIATLINAVEYLVDRKVPGDIAECGVWRGGSMMTVALTLLERGDTGRSLYLYDTFEGMSEPTDADKSHDGVAAADQLKATPRGTGVWCMAGLDDVRTNLSSTGYPKGGIHFIQGKVEETIPARVPASLALLRLDTDWYESTRHELTHLYPLLNPNGVLIIDDYGHWLGAKKAVDEYFQNHPVFLHR